MLVTDNGDLMSLAAFLSLLVSSLCAFRAFSMDMDLSWFAQSAAWAAAAFAFFMRDRQFKKMNSLLVETALKMIMLAQIIQSPNTSQDGTNPQDVQED